MTNPPSQPYVLLLIASLLIPSSLPFSMTANTSTNHHHHQDPYLWLEEVESDESLAFARESNAKCMEALGDPTASPTYSRILNVLESDDRIPYVTSYGVNDEGEHILYNFWKDKDHPLGLWRRTTQSSYQNTDSKTEWETVLDLDELAKRDEKRWVWKGSRGLPRSCNQDKQVQRALLQLSIGGADAVVVREFDLTTLEFVEDRPFTLPEAKSRVSYKSKDVLLVGTDFGPDSLTDSGYPRTLREWTRGTDIQDAPVVYEGQKTDVSVFGYISDQRKYDGGIYEVHGRSITFYTSEYEMRKILPEHLLAPTDPARTNTPNPPEFVKVNIPADAEFSLLGNMIIITLRSDWTPSDVTYKQGSVIFTNTDAFLSSSSTDFTVLFEPTETTAYEYFTNTKNFLVLSTMDSVKSKLDFYKIEHNGNDLVHVAGDKSAQIRDCSVMPFDAYAGSDKFWYTTSDFVTPSTLYMADATKANEVSEHFIESKTKALPPQYDADGLEVFQHFATSEDGTKVPYFIVMKADTVLDGNNPTLLYGYGGFEVSLTPHYIATAGLAWLERGGVYVEANIRGGGEFGPKWHQAALKANRNKAYEDFIAVAEDLIERKICTPKSLAARGGSNGGLLMGNMYTMRPDLFGAIHCAVPLLDMQRYHKLLAGASWMAEYGDPDTEDWDFIQKYSPYHKIDGEKKYPLILVTTSTRDDRVHPGHARKFVKKLWDNDVKDVYYYENIEGGHGGAADAKQSAFMLSLAYDTLFNACSQCTN